MEALTSSTIICPQCGGENTIPTEQKFLECEFCGSAVYIDKSKVVNHYVINCNFSPEQAEGNLRRWMADDFHVKDLDKNAQITDMSFYYFPLWYFKTNENGTDKISLQPGYSTAVAEIKNIPIPAGSLKLFKKSEFDESQFIAPDVLYDSARNWLAQSGVNTEKIIESNLVHIPFYQYHYSFQGTQYTALVEASSGKVYANMYPVKSEVPFRVLFALSIIVFLGVSLVSGVAAYLIEGGRGGNDILVDYEIIKILGYGMAAVPLVIIAYFVAKKA